jgi:hypothetical protein
VEEIGDRDEEMPVSWGGGFWSCLSGERRIRMARFYREVQEASRN